ncbi:alpha-L-fucosidase [Verrucomicrobium sp. GAS474]|uniref:alpha-L-fucosidase n=1 Tax=Verrucomicrobium sp. GAS474 TaxID=1882831 RepID=UPI0008798806|nr:alpha-L-fucosidase [Verrucomicrobium sp. GAS474]SDT92911.1 alpha-L-fucosidase [Verrucomicrobium sp. GAS474]
MSTPSPDPTLSAEVAAQHAQIGNVRKEADAAFAVNGHPDAAWFGPGGLGLFLHWGISAVEGEGDLSWPMMAREPGAAATSLARYGFASVQKGYTPARYWEQAARFTAENYDPGKWLAAAKAAGARYAVLTTRHHDGYALWPSAHGELGTATHLGGRDLVAPFVAACREHGLKVGLYYSPPDWHWNRHHMSFRYGGAKPDLGLHHEAVELPVLAPAEAAERLAAFRRHLKGQVEELLTRYGKIDLIWFDGAGQDAFTLDWLRELQPGIVVNERAHGYGDFSTHECRFPAQRPGGWWEYCHVWADGGWAYLNHETYKPMGWFLGELARARSWGGNFLPSAGPDAKGELPQVYYDRMRQLAAWMEHSGVSLGDVEPGPWPERSNVPITRKGSVWYAHFDWVHDQPALIEGVRRPAFATLLRDGKAVPFEWRENRLTVTIPPDRRTTLLDVVEIRWDTFQE